MRYKAPMLQPMYDSPIILDLEDFVSRAAGCWWSRPDCMCVTGGARCEPFLT